MTMVKFVKTFRPEEEIIIKLFQIRVVPWIVYPPLLRQRWIFFVLIYSELKTKTREIIRVYNGH